MTNPRQESDLGGDPFSQSTNKTSPSPMGSWAGSVLPTPSGDRGGEGTHPSPHPQEGGVALGLPQEGGGELNMDEVVAKWRKLCGPGYQVEVSALATVLRIMDIYSGTSE